MRIDIDFDVQAFDVQSSAYLRGVFNPAIAAGINAAANLIQGELVEGVNRNFDRPNAFSQKALGVLPARATGKYAPNVLISVKPQQAQYLELQIDGEIRRAGDYGTTKGGPIVPGNGARVNLHGNLPRGYVARMMQRKDVFWVEMGISRVPTLVQRNREDDLKILARIVERAEYKSRFNFFGIIEAGAAKHLNAEITKALARMTNDSEA